VVGITALWIFLYGSGLLLALLPYALPTPEKLLARLPYVLQGQFDLNALTDWIFGGIVASIGVAVIGMLAFGRKDV
jgi:hypothetical protein